MAVVYPSAVKIARMDAVTTAAGTTAVLEIGTAAITGTARVFGTSSSDRRVDIPVTAMPAYVEPGVLMATVPASAQTARIDTAVLVAQVAAQSLSSSVAAQAQRVTVPV